MGFEQFSPRAYIPRRYFVRIEKDRGRIILYEGVTQAYRLHRFNYAHLEFDIDTLTIGIRFYEKAGVVDSLRVAPRGKKLVISSVRFFHYFNINLEALDGNNYSCMYDNSSNFMYIRLAVPQHELVYVI